MARKGQTLGDFSADLIVALGGKPTKLGQQLFDSWQRWEGGWSNNAATYNPLNLTAPGSGLPTINDVGVVALPSYQAGIQRTANLIRSGYPTIAKALASGQYSFQNPALQADFNRWLTGKRTPGMSQYVSKIAGSLGQGGGGSGAVVGSPSPGAASAPTPPPSVSQSMPTFDEGKMAQTIVDALISGGGQVNFANLPQQVESAWGTQKVDLTPDATPTGAATGPTKPVQATRTGQGILPPLTFKATHQTSGLGWDAIDIMDPPGTPVRSPISGVVKYFHPEGAQGGGSMEIIGDDGQTYWLGHIANGLPGGTRIDPGTLLAVVANQSVSAPHLHWAKQ